MTKHDAWPSFSFTEMLRPPDGWRTDCAVLSTYSADLVVVVTSLLALTGCDLDNRRGSRVELVKAIEELRGKVCVLAQAGRVILPASSRPILKLLDRFLKTVDSDENVTSWHPKATLVRYVNSDDGAEQQWRVWIGSWNLTRTLNWDAGLVLSGRNDGKGRPIEGLASAAEGLATRAKLPWLRSTDLRTEFAKLTWECPAGSEVHRIGLLGPGQSTGFPVAPADTQRMFVISPFHDALTVRAASKWGGAKTHRTIVSTATELQRLLHEDEEVFKGFGDLLIQPLPDLPAEGADLRDEDDTTDTGTADGEEPQPVGLHAKLLFAAKGARRQLWLGSANATERGWKGGNIEIVGELTVSRGVADAIEEFVANCQQFRPAAAPPEVDTDEEALESARKSISSKWPLRQHIGDSEWEIIAREPPPIAPGIELEVAVLGGSWKIWPPTIDRVRFAGAHRWQRSDFIQLRVSINERTCAWLQLAPCEPPPDEERDHALIAQYLDPRTFLLWLRSMLADEPASVDGGGDWDGENPPSNSRPFSGPSFLEAGIGPSVEEILRSWSRDPSSFAAADDKVKAYLGELERRADERGATGDAEMLKAFRHTWDTLASELR